MLRIFLAIQLVCATLLLATCERSNMYDLAKYGLPPQTVIYIFPISQQLGNFGGRNNADNLCYQQGIAYHTLVKASTVKALVSYSVVDELRFLVPVQYWYFPVIGISSTMTLTTISSSWFDLLGGVFVNPIIDSVGLAGNSFWSGSNADGSVAATETCSQWQDSSSSFYGRYGVNGFYDGSAFCSNTYYVLCVAY
jgi:hypothetical protein